MSRIVNLLNDAMVLISKDYERKIESIKKLAESQRKQHVFGSVINRNGRGDSWQSGRVSR